MKGPNVSLLACIRQNRHDPDTCWGPTQFSTASSYPGWNSNLEHPAFDPVYCSEISIADCSTQIAGQAILTRLSTTTKSAVQVSQSLWWRHRTLSGPLTADKWIKLQKFQLLKLCPRHPPPMFWPFSILLYLLQIMCKPWCPQSESQGRRHLGLLHWWL